MESGARGQQLAFRFPVIVERDANALVHTHGNGHVECLACDALRDEKMFDPGQLARLPFHEASKHYLDARRPYWKTRTLRINISYVDALNRFFGQMVCAKIHIGHLREYQRCRTLNVDQMWTKPCGASIVNHETSVMQGVLKRAGRFDRERNIWVSEWEKIKPHFEALPEPSWRPPKVMSDQEEMRLFAVAASDPAWSLAYWVGSLTANTGASGTELRNLKIEDVQLDARIPCFRVDAATAKNEFRGRMVAMNPTAQQMMRRCLERSATLGAGRPQHYVFPFRIGPGYWDVTRPATASWLRRSWDALREAADLPWLTPHCLRHHHITLRYEAGESEQTISLGVGHQSARMTRHYSSLRRESQFAAVNAIDPTVRFGPKSAALDPDVLRAMELPAGGIRLAN